jgi:UDP-2,4-diacetamido-2,4,6-trideoxy-beta-L-altropyranose hydrolase
LRDLARDDPRVRLHVDAPAMEQLMLNADAAIGAGGSTTWERACLGLPALTVVLAGNQRAQAHALAARGLTLAVEAGSGSLESELRAGFTRLVGDAALRAEMSRLNMALCDGLGAARVADALTASTSAPQAPRSSEGS